MKRAIIILPTYNESANIEKLIASINHVAQKITQWHVGVLVVDSSSPDGTADVVRTLQKSISNLNLLVTGKHGLGKAYLDGFDYAMGKLQADVVFEMDADLSHDPADIPRFLHAVEKGADMVIGTRYSKGGSIPSNWRINRKILSIGANLIVRLGFMNLKQTEWTNGYRAIRKWVVQRIVPEMSHYTGYVFQVAFLDKALKAGAKVSEVPVHFVDRTEGRSKISAPQYTFQTLWYVFAHSSFIKFAIVGFSGMFIDVGMAAVLWKLVGLPILIANRISMELAVISNYIFNNFWSFSHKKHESFSQHVLAFIKFNAVALGSFVLQELGIRIGIATFGQESALVYKVFTILFVVIPYSYILYNKIIWKKK